MNADQVINQYARLEANEQAEFDSRYRSFTRFRKRSRLLLKEARRVGLEGAVLLQAGKARREE